MKILIEKGANINVTDKKGNSLLHTAVVKGHENIVKLLIEKGFDVNQKNKEGSPILTEAIHSKFFLKFSTVFFLN